MQVCAVCALRCLEKALIYPPENPFFCHYTNANNDTFVIQCCKHSDFCNKELKPSLHVKKEEGRSHSHSRSRSLGVTLEVSVRLNRLNEHMASDLTTSDVKYISRSNLVR